MCRTIVMVKHSKSVFGCVDHEIRLEKTDASFKVKALQGDAQQKILGRARVWAGQITATNPMRSHQSGEK